LRQLLLRGHHLLRHLKMAFYDWQGVIDELLQVLIGETGGHLISRLRKRDYLLDHPIRIKNVNLARMGPGAIRRVENSVFPMREDWLDSGRFNNFPK
jgi:hypothetical protein